MSKLTSLPSGLKAGYQNWHKTKFQDKKDLFADLVDHGQHPETMVISCCDSRVHPTELFAVDEGAFFVHRNIANFVPPYHPESDNQGTAAALQYAITALGVKHILVIGHAHCGGVQGCHDMCSGKNAALRAPDNAVGRWIEDLRPAYEHVMANDQLDDMRAMEQAAVLVSLDNLQSHPFVSDALAKGTISLHGLWHDIRSGTLFAYEPQKQAFQPL